MAALSGTDWERAEQTREAGCDIVLHCYADLPQMQEIASRGIEQESAGRFEKRASGFQTISALDKPRFRANSTNSLRA